MGAQQSKTDILKEVLNKISIEVLNKNSSSAHISNVQSNIMDLSENTGTTISGIKQINSAVINVTSLIDSSISGELQSDLIASISETIKSQASAIGYTANETNVNDIVSNTINSTITTENLQNISIFSQQENVLTAWRNTDSRIRDIVQRNEATLIAELIESTNNEIITSMQTKGDLKGLVELTTAPLFGLGGIGIFMIIGAIIIILFGINVKKVGGLMTKKNIIYGVALSLVLIGIIIFASN